MSGQRVAVAGDPSLVAAVEAAGGKAVDADEADAAAFVIAGGEAAVVDLARRGVDAPVLPVDAGAGVRSVRSEDLTAAVESVFADDAESEPRPVAWTDAGEVALFDVALMAAEPARISAFSIRHDGDRIAEFRADGVVASTPAGSLGYNRAADGPLLAAGTAVVAVVPIAPFATNADRWVLPADEVALAVERDETPVELLLDGRVEREVSKGDPVSLTAADGIDVLIVPESQQFF